MNLPAGLRSFVFGGIRRGSFAVSRGVWQESASLFPRGRYFRLQGVSDPIRGRKEGVFQLAVGGEESSPGWRPGVSCPRRKAEGLLSREV